MPAKKRKPIDDNRADTSRCTYINPKTGKTCTLRRLAFPPDYTRCLKHPTDKFPLELPAPVEDIQQDPLEHRTLKSLEDLRDFFEWLANAVLQEKHGIDNAKAKVLIEIIREQGKLIEKIWEKTPEGRERSLDQINRLALFARTIDPAQAVAALMSRGFTDILEGYAGALEVEEVQNDATDAKNAIYALQQIGVLSEDGKGDANSAPTP